MQKKIYILTVIAIVIVAFFIWKKGKVIAPAPLPETPASNASTTDIPTPVVNEPAPKTFSYTDDEFNFAVNLPGLTLTKKDRSSDPNTLFHPIVFSFGNSGGNILAVYIWKNKAEFDALMIGAENQGKVSINGKAFDSYKIVDGETTVYHYAMQADGVVYDIGVYDQNNASKFYFIKN